MTLALPLFPPPFVHHFLKNTLQFPPKVTVISYLPVWASMWFMFWILNPLTTLFIIGSSPWCSSLMFHLLTSEWDERGKEKQLSCKNLAQQHMCGGLHRSNIPDCCTLFYYPNGPLWHHRGASLWSLGFHRFIFSEESRYSNHSCKPQALSERSMNDREGGKHTEGAG